MELKHLTDAEMTAILEFARIICDALMAQESTMTSVTPKATQMVKDLMVSPRYMTPEETIVTAYLSELSTIGNAYTRFREKILVAFNPLLDETNVHKAVQELLAKIKSELP